MARARSNDVVLATKADGTLTAEQWEARLQQEEGRQGLIPLAAGRELLEQGKLMNEIVRPFRWGADFAFVRLRRA
jgi:hypothetical protein